MVLPAPAFRCLSRTPDLLGESPVWHPLEGCLYWVDIAGRALRRLGVDGHERHWALDEEPGCLAPTRDGDLLIALRSGVIRFDPASGRATPLAAAPYDTATTRFNDGRCDPRGRFWAGTVFEPKTAPAAALYRLRRGSDGRWSLEQHLDGNLTANGLAFSPDGSQAWWSNTPEHLIRCYDFDLAAGTFGAARVFQQFPRRIEGQPYGGRPDGAAVDSAGNYWVAMYEGACVRQFSPAGVPLLTLALPVTAPTMVCLGGPALRTLFVTSASKGRPPAELAAQQWSGHVLAVELDALPVAPELSGLPATLFDPDA